MRKDSYHIAMDDLTRFPLERSGDCETWEDISHDELNALLDKVDEERTKTFLAVVRGGSFARLDGFYYRIRPRS